MLLGAAAPGLTIDDLMRLLAAVPERHATFQEEKTVAQLTTPVHDSGTLDYVRPGRLEKHTLQPRDERLVVEGDRMWIVRPGEATRFINLEDQPEIGALVDTIRGTLAGDLALLRKSYDVAVSGTQTAWRLTLVPTNPRVARFLRVVHIDGVDHDLRTIETIESDGNSTRMMISPS